MSNSQGMHSPVEQFEIKPLVELTLGGYDVSFTNSSLFMFLAFGVSSLFLVAAMRRRAMVPGRMQSLAEMMYEFVAEMVRSNVGNEGRPYFPFIFTLFVFLLFGNMLGLIPYSYTFTSQIIVTFAMAAFVFVGVTLIALCKHGLHFFSFFVACGCTKSFNTVFDCDRGDFIFRPASQPFGTTIREHARWTYHVKGVCRACGDDFRCRWSCYDRLAASLCRVDWSDRTGSIGRCLAGLCVYHFNLHVFE